MMKSMLLTAMAYASAVSAEQFDYSGYAQTSVRVAKDASEMFETRLDHENNPEQVQLWKRLNQGEEIEYHLLLSPSAQSEMRQLKGVVGWEVMDSDVGVSIRREQERMAR